MSTGLAMQYVIVGLAVLASAWVVARKQFPGAVRRLRVALALPLVREGRPPWLRQVGRMIAPGTSSAASACGGCDNCGPTSAP